MKRFLRCCWCLVLAYIWISAAPAAQLKTAPKNIIIAVQGRDLRFVPQVNGLRDGLEELKYVEGENLNWSQVDGATQEDLRINLKSSLKQQRAHVIVTLGSAETIVAKELAPTIPIVFLPAADPVKSGFVRSLASPGTNLTGLTFFSDYQSVGKQLEVFKQAVPAIRRVSVILDDQQKSPRTVEYWNRLRAVASWLGIELTEQVITSPAEAAQKISLLSNVGSTTGIFVVCSGLFKDLEGLAAVAMKRNLPLFGCNAFQVAEQNVLLSYAPDLYSLGYRGAWFVDRVFKGSRPQDLPVETPRKFELVINTKVAADIGAKISPETLILADRVFR